MSWKTFGGINQIKTANINTKSIATDDIILRKAYAGDFVINGSIIVYKDAEISGNMIVRKHSSLNDVCMNSLIVNNSAIFNGNVNLTGSISGNNIITETFQSIGNAEFNSKVYYNDHYLFGNANGIGIDKQNPVAALDICSNLVAGLNIFTSNSTNKNILASNRFNKGIVVGASGSQNTSIDFFTNTDISNTGIGDSYIHCSTTGPGTGKMTLKTPTETQILSNIVVSGNQNNMQTQHLTNETLAVYDNKNTVDGSGQYYFSNVYNRDYETKYYTTLGKSAAFISSDSSLNSVTQISLTNKNKCGGLIVGGAFPLTDNPLSKHAMLSYGISDQSGNYVPTETIVEGSPTNTKYLATTGINTYMPRINNYVLDINGPVMIDNGDIVNVKNTNFEILQIKHAIDPMYKNYLMSVGASIDVSGNYIDSRNDNAFRYAVLCSKDGGATWDSTILYPSTDSGEKPNAVLNGNILNHVEIYDCSYAFITGNNNTIIYTWNGGKTWQNIVTTGVGEQNKDNFNSIAIKKNVNSFKVFFSIDSIGSKTSKFATFDVLLSELNGNYFSKQISINNTSIHINSIGLSDNYLYVAGDKIIMYDFQNLSVAYKSFSTISAGVTNYVWSKIQVYNDNYAIAIASGIIEGYDGIYFLQVPISMVTVIKNGQMYNWDSYSSGTFVTTMQYGEDDNGSPIIFNYPMECIIKDVHIYDLSNALIIGNCLMVDNEGGAISNHVNGSFILLSSNAYSSNINNDMSWNDMPSNLLNASGKMNLLVSPNVSLNNLTIPNANTIFFTCTTTSSVLNTQDLSNSYYSVIGASAMYSCFTPNYLNFANNHVMDICGNVSIYGAFFANSIKCNGAVDTTSDYRIKTDIVPLPTHDILDKLRPVQYTNTLNGKCEWGFIAHELQEHLPELVQGEKDGDNYQSINYNGIISLLVKEIQVLKNEIRDLKNM
jgi:hypothetical protein